MNFLIRDRANEHYKDSLRLYEAPILIQKDPPVKYPLLFAKLSGPTMQYLSLQRCKLFNKQPSNVRDPKALEILSTHGEPRDQDPRKPGDISGSDPESGSRAAMVPSAVRLDGLLEGKNGATESNIPPTPNTGDLEIRASRSKRFMDALEPSVYNLNKKEPSVSLSESENEILSLRPEWTSKARDRLSIVAIPIERLVLIYSFCLGTKDWVLSARGSYRPLWVFCVRAFFPVYYTAIITYLLAQETPGCSISLNILQLTTSGTAYNAIFDHTIIRLLSRYAKIVKLRASNILRIVGWSEPQLEDGKSRVRWKCVSLRIFQMHSSKSTKVFVQRCGRKIYDDFIELRPGAAKDLENLLKDSARSRPMQNHGQKAVGSPRDSLILSAGSSSHQQAAGSGLDLQTPPEAYDPRPHYRRPRTTILDLGLENRWLLVCAKASKSPIGLAHLNVCDTSSDKELFEKIRASYLQLHSKWKYWLSLKRVQAIRFVQVHSQKLHI